MGVYSANGLYVWTLGLVLYEMLFACKPFQSCNDIVHTSCALFNNKTLTLEAQSLVAWMLTKSVHKRISLNELTHHPWVTKKWI
jgi:serine/threonine protein kinase